MVLKLASLIQFADQLESPSVSLDADRCLLRRHKEAPCRICIDTCPTQAITKGDPVALDDERCVDCGLCLHRCPTEAFTRPGNRTGKLLNVLGSLENGRVELACPSKSKMAASRADVATVVAVKPCLGIISISTLLAAVTQRMKNHGAGRSSTIWLNDEACEDCPIGSVQGEINRTAATANQLLVAFGNKSKILTYSGSPDLLNSKAKKRPVEQGNQARYTRRGLFRSLTAPVERALENEPETDQIDSPLSRSTSEGVSTDLLRLPEARQPLVRSLRQLGQPLEAQIELKGLPFGSVSIEGACVACGLCARFCPSEALAFEEDNGTFSIAFSAAACLGCAICTLICPTEAVEMKNIVEPRRLVAGTTDTLVTGDLAACCECGMSCAADRDEPLCFVCRWRKTVPADDVYGTQNSPPSTIGSGIT